MKEDKILIAQINDKIRQCENNYMITNTGFLDMRQQTILKDSLRGNSFVKGYFFGGYEDAERKILVFTPDYIEIEKPTISQFSK